MTIAIPMEKWQGIGNHFYIVKERDLEGLLDEEKWPDLAKSVCNPNFGLGADGLLFVKRWADGKNVVRMRMTLLNSDGSRAEMCGNGIRCVAAWMIAHSYPIDDKYFVIETDAGPKKIEVVDGQYRVDMGPPIFDPEKIPVNADYISDEGIPRVLIEALAAPGRVVSMGNPHVVIPMAHLDQIPIAEWGPMVEKDPHFPERVNTEFAEPTTGDPHRIKVRVWERGAGLTLACGTGACAVTVVGILEGALESPVEVELPGGNLIIEWDGQEDSPVFMTGPAEKVGEATFFYKEGR